MIKSIFSTIYMNHVTKQVREQYGNLTIEEKKAFLERIQRRRLGDSVCNECPEEESANLVSLCNLCNIICLNFDNLKIDNEINLLVEKNDRKTSCINARRYSENYGQRCSEK